MKKIIALTGSFNPVSVAHYKILTQAVDEFQADEGVFVATSDAYLHHKLLIKSKPACSFILDEKVRAEMLRSLSKDNPKLSYWGHELGGVSSDTYKTLQKICRDMRKKYNDDITLYILQGGDKMKGMPHWRNRDKLFAEFEIVVFDRNTDLKKLIRSDPFLNDHSAHIHVMTPPQGLETVSSTEIRRRFFAGEDYSELMNRGPYEILSKYTTADFPPVDGETLVRAQYKWGGRFKDNAARIQVYKNNTELFKSWPAWLGDRDAHRKATVYNHGFTVQAPVLVSKTDTCCVNADCADVAKQMLDEGLHPAILNLADRFIPCGGYQKGSYAQEECLCRMSTLSQSLYQYGSQRNKCVRDAGVTLVPGVYPLDLNYGGIYSPTVTFFRYGEGGYYAKRILDDAFDCPVVTVASLSNRDSSPHVDMEKQYFDPDGRFTATGRDIQKNKIRTIYRIGLVNGHDSLVLGAFGCGAFRLLPEEVAPLFREVLDEPEFRGRFRKLVFAILEGKPSSRKTGGKNGKFAPFYDEFGGK